MRCTNASAFKGEIDGIRKRQRNREAEMSYLQNSYSVGFKAKVALEAIRGARTIPEIAIEYGVPANQITKWKKQVIDELPSILAVEAEKQERTAHDLIFKLYEEIAQLSGELGRVKKAEAGS
jgi:transposase-like protein